jgi:hypothetical protein
MKGFASDARVIWGLALLAGGLVACSESGTDGPTPGVATVGFVPKPIVLPNINLSRASTRLDRLQIIGNVPPPPPPGSLPPPDSRPPPDGYHPPEATVNLDALASTPSTGSIENLPQGLYSRMRFMIGRISLEGRARGTPFQVSLAPFGAVVDIRASVPQELGLDHDVAFDVSVDPNLWFPPYVFEGATLDNRGVIICDDVSNTQIGSALIQSMLRSFSLQ